jgi:hypothetical protein
MVAMSDKTCVSCKISFPYSQFSRDKRRPDGYFPYCKKCKRESHLRASHDPQKARVRRQKWATANAERFREIQQADSKKRYYEKYALDPQMREEARLRARAQYRANKARHAECAKRWKEANRDKCAQAARARHLQKEYGLTFAEYNAMVEKQDGLCAICGGPPMNKHGKLYVDHCHNTGKVRALLCDQCNHGLGNFRDDIELVAAALEYLKRYAS